MKKRILALLMASAMLVGLLAGCGSSSSSTATSDASASSETSESASDSADSETPSTVEVTEVSLPFGDGEETHSVWMGISPSAMNYISSLAENQTYAELMERTGVNLEFQHFHPDQQTTQFTLICASGDYPCVMNGVANDYTGGPDAAIEDEVFIDHTDLMQEYAPNYWNMIVSDADLWDAVTTAEDQIVGFYGLYSTAMLNDSGYVIRQDYLDDVGMDAPTTPSTLKEVLTAFRDEEGTTDGLFIPASGVAEFVLGAFGVGTGFYVEDDTIKYGPVEDGFKDYLEYMNELYTEGLVYGDFPFYGEQIMFRDQGLIGSGAVALFSSETGDMTSFASDDEDFLLSAVAPIVSEDTGIAVATEKAPSRADDIRWSITTGCEEPEHLVQMIDYMYSDEGSLLCNYGIEGITFEYVDGQPVLTDLIVNNPDGLDYRTALFLNLMDAGPCLVDENRGTQDYTAEQLSARDNWTSANIDYSGVIPDKAALSQEENEELGQYTTDLETYMDEWVVKFIIGDASLDQFDDYVAGMKTLNVERCIELYQQAYDRYLED
jgi:putative aldouronate transport system substrate-binding protein